MSEANYDLLKRESVVVTSSDTLFNNSSIEDYFLINEEKTKYAVFNKCELFNWGNTCMFIYNGKIDKIILHGLPISQYILSINGENVATAKLNKDGDYEFDFRDSLKNSIKLNIYIEISQKKTLNNNIKSNYIDTEYIDSICIFFPKNLIFNDVINITYYEYAENGEYLKREGEMFLGNCNNLFMDITYTDTIKFLEFDTKKDTDINYAIYFGNTKIKSGIFNKKTYISFEIKNDEIYHYKNKLLYNNKLLKNIIDSTGLKIRISNISQSELKVYAYGYKIFTFPDVVTLDVRS